LGGQHRATSWPVTLQGPLVRAQEDANCLAAIKDGIFGIRSEGRRLDIVVTGGIEVRFDFESEDDKDALDERVVERGVVIERMQVDGEEDGMKMLISEGGEEEVYLYLIDGRGIHAVNTCAVRDFEKGAPPDDGEDTDAWCCMNVGEEARICGAVVSGDAMLGHILVAKLDNGQLESVNLTATQFIHQSHTFLTPPPVQTSTTSSALPTPSFQTKITPLVTQITKELSSMGRIVGSSTLPSAADASTLATFQTLHSKLEKGLALPLSQLHTQTKEHDKMLREMYKKQKKQLETLKATQEQVVKKLKKNLKMAEVIDTNAKHLAERSANILSSSRELMPKISFAEKEYHSQLKRYSELCDKWEKESGNLRIRAENKIDLWEQGMGWDVDLNDDELEMSLALLRGQKLMLKKGERRLKDVLRNVEALGNVVGEENM